MPLERSPVVSRAVAVASGHQENDAATPRWRRVVLQATIVVDHFALVGTGG